MTTLREAAQQALGALEILLHTPTARKQAWDAITALRAALEHPEPGGVCARCGGWVYDPVIAQPDQADSPAACWKCGAEDGGTSCGAAGCGLIEAEPDAKTFNDGVLEGVMRERAQWQSVFGHLGSADEVGNDWISIREQRDKLLDALNALCESHKRFFGGSWDNARSVIKEVKSKR